VNAYQPAALGTAPLFLFVSNEISYTSLADKFEVVNHAHAIPGSIPLIQVIQPGAREAVTTEAVLNVAF